MIGESFSSKSNNERLTFSDLGVDLQKIKDRKIVALGLAGAVTLAGVSVIESIRQDADPVASTEQSHQPVQIEGVATGTKLEVMSSNFTITGGNVRSSANAHDSENLIDSDLAGITIERPISVADETNPKNGNWYVFFDSEGKKFAINEQNVVPSDPQDTSGILDVVVAETTTQGILATDASGKEIRVATIVDITR